MKTVVDIDRKGSKKLDTQALTLELTHDARHLRRKVFDLGDGNRMLIDLPEATVLHQGDRLILEDGTCVRICAADEDLYDICATDAVHLSQLAWHIGNRHLAAEIRGGSIRILRDHVIKDMLEKLGAQVDEIRAPFVPVRGAYSQHHAHNHGH